MKSLLIAALFATATASADEITLKPVVGGLVKPTSIVHAGDSRLFIAQQTGRIAVYDGTRILAQPFLDVSSIISSGEERGLLGLAFSPHYRDDGTFYVDYTNVVGDTVIARYRVSATDPNRADASSAQIILTIAQPYPNHNGGELQFGPDGYLYIGMGDGGSGGDPQNRAQSLGTLLGKILRIDVGNAVTYRVPASNPFASRGGGAQPEIWAWGLRNPWRFSFDRLTGDLWIADVGQDNYEEIDFQRATSIGGENYGWRLMEGFHCYNPSSNCNDGTLTLPVLEYSHADGSCSVTGGYRYRGAFYPRLYGTYFYGDYCSGKLWGATANDAGGFTSRLLLDTTMQITTFGEDANGELYVADYKTGTLYSITDAEPGPARHRAARH